jgi:hypothetical protein
MIALWLIGSVLAHQGTAFDPTETAVLAGKHFALMQVVTATRPGSNEARTRMRLIEPIEGAPPQQADVVQRGPHQHALQKNALVLMPLSKRGETWAYLAQTRRPLVVDPKQQRQAVAFVKRWRAQPSRSPEALAPEWINLLNHPADVARRVGHEALVRYAPRLKATLTAAQLDGIAQPLTDPGIPAAEHIARVRMLGLLGGRDGARRIAKVFDQLSSDRVRRMAVGVLGRFAVSEAKTVLRRCAETARGSLRTRCSRVVQSLDGPTP